MLQSVSVSQPCLSLSLSLLQAHFLSHSHPPSIISPALQLQFLQNETRQIFIAESAERCRKRTKGMIWRECRWMDARQGAKVLIAWAAFPFLSFFHAVCDLAFPSSIPWAFSLPLHLIHLVFQPHFTPNTDVCFLSSCLVQCSCSINVSSAVLLLNGKEKVQNKLPSLRAEEWEKIEEVNKNKRIRGVYCSTANLHPMVNGCSYMML